MFIPIYKLGCVFLLGLHAFLFCCNRLFLAGVALTFTTAFCFSFSRPLMKLAQLVLSQNLCNSLSKNEGPNMLPHTMFRIVFRYFVHEPTAPPSFGSFLSIIFYFLLLLPYFLLVVMCSLLKFLCLVLFIL
jgi:hypothetical protein